MNDMKQSADAFVRKIARQQHTNHNANRPQGSPRIDESDCVSCEGFIDRWGGIYTSSFEAGWKASQRDALADLLRRLVETEEMGSHPWVVTYNEARALLATIEGDAPAAAGPVEDQ